MDWRDRAACLTVDPEIFFPFDARGRAVHVAEERAKAVCTGCPVRAECREFALAALPYGIAGGLTAEERRRAGGTKRIRTELGVDPDPVADLPARAPARDIREAGMKALRAGRHARDVASSCGVTVRTAERWAAAMRQGTEARSA